METSLWILQVGWILALGHDTVSDWQAALILLGHTSSRARASRVTEVSEGGEGYKEKGKLIGTPGSLAGTAVDSVISWNSLSLTYLTCLSPRQLV